MKRVDRADGRSAVEVPCWPKRAPLAKAVIAGARDRFALDGRAGLLPTALYNPPIADKAIELILTGRPTERRPRDRPTDGWPLRLI